MTTNDDGVIKGCVAVTGCCGTIGTALVQFLQQECPDVSSIIAIDDDENALFYFGETVADEKTRLIFADIRQKGSVEKALRGVGHLFHLAALKHVGLGEKNVEQYITSNVIGVQNVIAAASRNDVQRVVFTSSDKAVNPTNTMGATKLLGERLITEASGETAKTRFISTRFGNVIGSRGSVVEIFRSQIRQQKPLTITDENMSRFLMTRRHAIDLLMFAWRYGLGGEVIVPKMHAVKITDLARAIIIRETEISDVTECGQHMKVIGARVGEKLYEELISLEEVNRTIFLENFIVVAPVHREKGRFKAGSYPTSEADTQNGDFEIGNVHSGHANYLDVNQILDLLDQSQLADT